MTANAPIDFEIYFESMGVKKKDRVHWLNFLNSIAGTIEAQAIERILNYYELDTTCEMPRLYGPKSDKEEGKDGQ